ncbi:MAG: hypothetical protein IPN38_17305 [Flavobacteriales bacterium]|nr:hypothetical protein [Flavobacteriales bacterium]
MPPYSPLPGELMVGESKVVLQGEALKSAVGEGCTSPAPYSQQEPSKLFGVVTISETV